MRIADPARSRAVLIGTAFYRHAAIDDLPSVSANLVRLAELLRDPAVWGLPAEHCVVLAEPDSGDAVLDAVRIAGQSATDTLVVYFAGHGLLDLDGDLLLGMPGSEPEIPYRSLRYGDVRRQVLNARNCPAKVVILDCCFSGRAMAGGMSSMTDLADHAAVDGSSLLTAAAETKVALAPPDERYTAFTGELIKLLEEGIADAPPLLTVDALFWKMQIELMAKGRPKPQQRSRNAGAGIAFVRNRWLRPDVAPAREVVEPEQPVDLPFSPAGAVAEVDRLRARSQRDEAAAVLIAVGRQWPDQRVAATLSLLVAADRPADAGLVFDGVSGRPAAVAQSVLEMLAEDFGTAPVAALMSHLARWLPERAAQLIIELRAAPELRVLAGELIKEFVAAALQRPHRVIDLITGLFVRSDPAAAEQVLGVVTATVVGADLATIADALRAAGREAEAFALYSRTVDALADRPAEQLGALALGLRAHRRADVIGALLVSAVTRRRDEAARADVIMAFARSGRLDGELSQVAETLTDGQVLRLSGLLRERAGSLEATTLVRLAAERRSVPSVARFVNTLVAEGWPRDALQVIEAVSPGRTAAEIELLTRTVADTPQRGRTRAAFAALPAEPPARWAELCVLLAGADRSRLSLLQAQLGTRPATAIGVAVELTRGGRADLAGELLRAADDGDLSAVVSDLPTASRLLAAAVEADAPALAQRIIAVVRSAHARGLGIFVLAGHFARRGMAATATSLLAGRLHLPADRAGDHLAAAVAEVLHSAGSANGDTTAYPVDDGLVRRLRTAHLLAADDVCLLVCQLPARSRERLLVFSSLGFTHSEHPLVRYRDLPAMASIVALGGRIHLLPEPGSDVPAAEWPVATEVEERQTVELLRELQAVVREVLSMDDMS